MMAPLIDLLNHSFDDNADYEFEITPAKAFTCRALSLSPPTGLWRRALGSS